jgi:hypothetical protein
MTPLHVPPLLPRGDLEAFGKAHPFRNIDLHGGSMAALFGSDTVTGASYICNSSSPAGQRVFISVLLSIHSPLWIVDGIVLARSLAHSPPTHALTRILAHPHGRLFTRSPAHPLTHPLTRQPGHAPTHSLAHPLTHQPTHPPVCSLTDPPAHTNADCPNPRGWNFLGCQGKKDQSPCNTTTPEGIANFEAKARAYFQSAVTRCQKPELKCRAIMAWSIEGSEWSDITYSGSPDMLPVRMPLCLVPLNLLVCHTNLHPDVSLPARGV